MSQYIKTINHLLLEVAKGEEGVYQPQQRRSHEHIRQFCLIPTALNSSCKRYFGGEQNKEASSGSHSLG